MSCLDELAIAAWREWKPHLIWMKMRMPAMDGYEVAHLIRRQEKAKNSNIPTKIIALTANSFENETSMILSVGCDDLICKPFDEEMIFNKIAQHLPVSYSCEYLSPFPIVMSSPPDSPQSFLSGRLSIMSDAWKLALQQSALAVDGDQLLQLIQQIPPEQHAIAKHLQTLVSNFDFDQILVLIDNA